MICTKCGKEVSDKVFKLHFARCVANTKKTEPQNKPITKEKEVVDSNIPTEKDEEEVRAKAKELKINNYWNKSIENLEKEISEIEVD